MTYKISLLSLAMAALAAVPAQASLVTNGTFDTGLSGWDVETTIPSSIGVTWDNAAKLARIGQPGTPGVTTLSQDINIPTGTSALLISFDYSWWQNQPTNPDTFSLLFDFGSGPQVIWSQQSDDPLLNFQTTKSIVNLPLLLPGSVSNGTIAFQLTETNQSVGTRIHLDNVSIVAAVPEASAVAVWSLLSGVGLVASRRRSRAEDQSRADGVSRDGA